MLYIRNEGDELALGSTLALCARTGLWRADHAGVEDACAFLLPHRNEAVLITTASEPVQVGQMLVRGGLHVVRGGETLAFERLGRGYTLEFRLEAVTGVTSEPGDVCPVCKAELQPGETFAACGNCGTRHHVRCLRARASRCGVYGCLAVTPIPANTPATGESR